MNKNIIEVKDLKKIYNPKKKPIHALKGVSFSVSKGEIFGLLGVNGAGKSTTLNILMGLLTPTSGSIRVFDQDFFKHETEVKERMNIATAYAHLATNLTVYRNLKVYAVMYGVKDYEHRIDALLSEFGLTDLRNKWFGDLSAGEKTRVNLCKSMINHPEILLLDEPTASLDPSIARHVREHLLKLQKKYKTTIIFTSHNMDEVEEVCDRAALLHKGEIYMIDTPKKLVSSHKAPDLEEVFVRLARGEYE